MPASRTIVIGGGLIGIATAYELQRRGIPVILIEKHEEVALGASFANGATLTPSMSDPWNAPGFHRPLLASLFDPGAAMKLRLRAFPAVIPWGLRFMRNSTVERHRALTRASFRLAHFSVERTREVTAQLGDDFRLGRGSLKIFRDAGSIAGPLAIAEMLAPLGLRFESIDAREAVAKEPALRPIENRLAGALFFPDDGFGDARLFSLALLRLFLSIGGEARFGGSASAIETGGDGVQALTIGSERIRASKIVVATGTATRTLLKPLGVALPIYPVKGYTLSFAMPEGPTPRLPVIDDALHALVVPLGDRLRVAGTAEFTGPDLRLAPERIRNLVNLLGDIYPDLAGRVDVEGATPWAGLRPMSPDGLPFIGATRVPGLFVNAGHGHLGWTEAMGSAALLADALTGQESKIDPAPYRPDRRA